MMSSDEGEFLDAKFMSELKSGTADMNSLAKATQTASAEIAELEARLNALKRRHEAETFRLGTATAAAAFRAQLQSAVEVYRSSMAPPPGYTEGERPADEEELADYHASDDFADFSGVEDVVDGALEEVVDLISTNTTDSAVAAAWRLTAIAIVFLGAAPQFANDSADEYEECKEAIASSWEDVIPLLAMSIPAESQPMWSHVLGVLTDHAGGTFDALPQLWSSLCAPTTP
jgi:hypothetical protein